METTETQSREERATADLVDAFRDSGRIQSCEVQFRHFGGRIRFHGPIHTIKTWEDNALIKRILSEPGNGHVLVVDGGGSLRTALVGDNIAGLGVSNGWAGLVLWGAVRDTGALQQLDLGIKALGSNPWTSGKNGVGVVNVTVEIGNATFAPGRWVYADEDGIIVADGELA